MRRLHPARQFLLIPLLLVAAACGRGSPSGTEQTALPAAVEPTRSGRLEDATPLNRVAIADIIDAVRAAGSRTPSLTPLYEVVNYRLSYLTIDSQGKEIVASGLVSVPVKTAGAKSPLLSYQHATIYKDAQAPSNNPTPAAPPVIVASLGYIVIAADYVGYGASKGTPHPYLLSAPSASAVVDMLTAARTWRSQNSVADNGQLFLAGYSEGGYVSVAAHRAMQAAGSPHVVNLAAVALGAGPYDAGVTLDELLRRVRKQHPLLGTLINPGLLRHLGASLRRAVRDELLKRLVPADADVVFDATLIDNYLADDDAAIERQSNVHDWAPAVPARFFHGRDDQTVPYVSATRTLQAMLARGASDISLTDCAALPSSHKGCVPQFLAFMLGEFAARARDL
jgi:pimeloyl-ACP methyl ester carboxylesterase